MSVFTSGGWGSCEHGGDGVPRREGASEVWAGAQRLITAFPERSGLPATPASFDPLSPAGKRGASWRGLVRRGVLIGVGMLEGGPLFTGLSAVGSAGDVSRFVAHPCHLCQSRDHIHLGLISSEPTISRARSECDVGRFLSFPPLFLLGAPHRTDTKLNCWKQFSFRPVSSWGACGRGRGAAPLVPVQGPSEPRALGTAHGPGGGTPQLSFLFTCGDR